MIAWASNEESSDNDLQINSDLILPTGKNKKEKKIKKHVCVFISHWAEKAIKIYEFGFCIVGHG